MGEKTTIGWTHHTFNPWWGCHKVSPACKNCYAESFAKRTGHPVWGASAGRRFFGDKYWANPLKWNRDAEKAGERRRVFCGSMMDVLEMHPDPATHSAMSDARHRLRYLIAETPHLDWLLLTKRPENFSGCSTLAWGETDMPPNVWFGTTVEDQEHADLRIPHLLKVNARVLFLSCEPLLGPIDLRPFFLQRLDLDSFERSRRPTWVIAGGESGAHHREHQLEWSRSLRDQCAAAGVPFFFKQLGEAPTELDPYFRPDAIGRLLNPVGAPTRHHLALAPRSKGESLDEIPPDLRVRELPGTP